jgi:chemosensory pili system protein ChpA (sensor histidine kinase/response regulator)
MPMQIQDYLLPMLITGMVGVFVGAILAGWLREPRHGAAPARQAPPSHRDEAAPPSTSGDAPRALRAGPRWPWQRAQLLPQAADLLVVDDSAVARFKLGRLLEAAGYQVRSATDGAEALAMLQAGRYALMLTDLEMPNMDGATLIDHCRRMPHTARMPILAVTGHENLRAKFNQCRSISGVHRKPWVDDILLSHVAALVGTRHGAAHAAKALAARAARPGAAAQAGRPADLAAR